MEIILENIGKKFSRQWIFKNISYQFSSGDIVAITGPNGSGKSTLLQIISGMVSPSEGAIHYHHENKKIGVDEIYAHLTLAAPYMELIENFTLSELIEFYKKFKPFHLTQQVEIIVEKSGLAHAVNKEIKYYSSGMKQRVKLTLALLAQSEMVLLDEPLSNLDKKSVDWFYKFFRELAGNRVIIIASNNVEQETVLCNKFVDIEKHISAYQ